VGKAFLVLFCLLLSSSSVISAQSGLSQNRELTELKIETSSKSTKQNYTISSSSTTWALTLGGAKDDEIHSIQQTNDGGFVAIGTTQSFTVGSALWVIRLDASGTVLWEKTFGGSLAYDNGTFIQQTQDGGYILAGEKGGAWIIKLDKKGDISWQKEFYGSQRGGSAFTVQETSDNGYIVSGGFYGSTGYFVARFIKLDQNGSVSWKRNFKNGLMHTIPVSILQTNDGGYIAAGESMVDSYTIYGWLLKINSNGHFVWTKSFGFEGEQLEIWSSQITNDGGVIVAGDKLGYVRPWLAKFNADGNIIWQKTYPSSTVYRYGARSIQQTSDDGFIVAGAVGQFNTQYRGAWVMKTDNDGDVLWQKSYGTDSDWSLRSISQNSDGGYIVAGVKGSTGTNSNSDAMIMRINENGEIIQCDAVGTADANPTTASANFKNLSVTYESKPLTTINTTIIPQNTSAKINLVCSGIPSLSISHIEVTQAIQDEKEPDEFPLVPLVEGKTTFVRVYLDCDSNCPKGKVTGTVTSPNEESVNSHNKVYVNNVATWQGQRGDLSKTLNFTLPQNWTIGTQTFTIQVKGVTVKKDVTFISTRNLKITYVPINDEGFVPDHDRIITAHMFMQKIYPASNIDYPYKIIEPAPVWNKPLICIADKYILPTRYHDCIVSDLKNMLNNLYSNEYGDFLFGWLPAESDIAGSGGVYGDSDAAWYDGGQGHIAFGRDHQSENGFILAHEIAHLLGQHHTNKGQLDPWPCENEGIDTSSLWPYPSPNIFFNQHVWGLDGHGFGWRIESDSALKDPNKTYDYMSYCGSLTAGNVWTSPWTYKQILEEVKIKPQSSSINSERLHSLDAAQPYFTISGVIFSDNTAFFDPIWITLTDTPKQNPPPGTTYCIEAKDVGDNVLVQYCFDLDFWNYELGKASSTDGFFFTLPYPAGVSRFVLKKGSLELSSQDVSANPPMVSVTYPNSGENWSATGSYTITWDASDSDGNTLSFNVYYSSDGIHWLPLAIEIPDTQLTVDASELPGSNNAFIRVAVSDGVNTSSDESDVSFAVGSKTPQTTITSPGDNETAVFGSPLLFSGFSYDVDDGLLDDCCLSWSSNIDGALGTGSTILTTLSAGQHTITLSATDSDLNTGTAEISMTVLDCHTLTLTHTGKGVDPVASPTSSTGCPQDEYLAGEFISLTASPKTGWSVSNWTGTNDDSSTDSTNALSMPSNDHIVTVSYKEIKIVLKSQRKFDGWIRESGEFTRKGGSKNNLGKVLLVGDDLADRQYRAILSFGTAGIPDNAVITKVILKVKRAGVVGTNPMKTHNGLVVDIKKGKFYTLPALQVNDFQAKAGMNKAGKFSTTLYSGWYRSVLYTGAYDYINLKGRTQLRLRFLLDDDNDNYADILKLFSGNAIKANRPQLIVKYYVP